MTRYGDTDGPAEDSGFDGEIEEIVELEDTEPYYDWDQVRDPDAEVPATALSRWRKGTTAGMMLTGIGLGLQEALGMKKEQPSIVREAPGQNEDDDVVLHFDPDSPENTWLEIKARPEA